MHLTCTLGTICALATIEALVAGVPKLLEDVEIVVALNAAEEEMTQCFGSLCRDLMQGADACLVFETGAYDPKSRTYTLVEKRKGRAVWRLTARGKETHAGNGHREGRNAILTW